MLDIIRNSLDLSIDKITDRPIATAIDISIYEHVTDTDYNQLNTAQWEYDMEPKADTELQFSATTYYKG